MAFDQEFIGKRLETSSRVILSLKQQADDLLEIAQAIRHCFAVGGTLYTCGNGGSAAEALHLAEELIGKYKRPREPKPAVCLNADPTALTCIANDFGFESIFARQIEALGRPNDILLCFSTSGMSENLVMALEKAGDKQVTTIGLLGKGGGTCLDLCDHALVVASDETEAIQEAHQVILHLILEAVETA